MLFRTSFHILLAILSACTAQAIHAQALSERSLIIRPDFPSAFSGSHTIRIWLPPAYDPRQRYPVLYVHDGQMLFSGVTTWNGLSWHIDLQMDSLVRTGRIRPAIVVGIDNAGRYRASEYFPEAILDSLSPSLQHSLRTRWLQGEPRADAYLAFIVKELKPYVDSAYSTLADRDNTYILGSSMGGLISLYALCEYPEVFGAAGCLSTHWPMYFPFETPPEPVDFPFVFRQYLRHHLPAPGHHRLYFDCGDQTLDALYPPLQAKVDELLRELGFGPPDWVTRAFPGMDHSENAWRARFSFPAEFLLAPR